MSPEHCISAPICWCITFKAAATTKIQKIGDYSYVNKIMKNSREIERISQFICLVRIFAFRYPAEIFYGRYKKPYEKLLGVSWPSLVFRPCNLTVMGSQYFKGLETGKCLAFLWFFLYLAVVLHSCFDIFVVIEFVSLFQNERSSGPTGFYWS